MTTTTNTPSAAFVAFARAALTLTDPQLIAAADRLLDWAGRGWLVENTFDAATIFARRVDTCEDPAGWPVLLRSLDLVLGGEHVLPTDQGQGSLFTEPDGSTSAYWFAVASKGEAERRAFDAARTERDAGWQS